MFVVIPHTNVLYVCQIILCTIIHRLRYKWTERGKSIITNPNTVQNEINL